MGSRADALERIAHASGRCSGTVRVLVLSGSLAPASVEPSKTSGFSVDWEGSTGNWEGALLGVVGATQVTLGVIRDSANADDAAILLLCDVVLVSDAAELEWDRGLPPPAVSIRVDEWLAPDSWSPQRALRCGLVSEVVPAAALDDRVAEWLEALQRWDHSTLLEARALLRGPQVDLKAAISAWSQARHRGDWAQ